MTAVPNIGIFNEELQTKLAASYVTGWGIGVHSPTWRFVGPIEGTVPSM